MLYITSLIAYNYIFISFKREFYMVLQICFAMMVRSPTTLVRRDPNFIIKIGTISSGYIDLTNHGLEIVELFRII